MFSKIFGRPLRVVTDRIFPRYFAARDYRRGVPELPPLNGQSGRRAIVERIMADCGIEQIVETGTFRGSTTRWFVRFGVPIHSVEANPRFAEYVRRVFAAEPTIHLAEMDSAAFLEELAGDAAINAKVTFFYLDAHWGRRLPLGEEIRTVTQSFPDAVMVIDDFRVEDDPDYGFDDYGPGMRLDLDYVRNIGVPGLQAFFPVLSGRDEDGPKRGCVALTTNAALAGKLRQISLLRPYPLDPITRNRAAAVTAPAR